MQRFFSSNFLTVLNYVIHFLILHSKEQDSPCLNIPPPQNMNHLLLSLSVSSLCLVPFWSKISILEIGTVLLFSPWQLWTSLTSIFVVQFPFHFMHVPFRVWFYYLTGNKNRMCEVKKFVHHVTLKWDMMKDWEVRNWESEWNMPEDGGG